MVLEPLGRFMRKGQAGSEYRVAALLPCDKSRMAAFEEGHNDALGIQIRRQGVLVDGIDVIDFQEIVVGCLSVTVHLDDHGVLDRKSTRLNSSHECASRILSSA